MFPFVQLSKTFKQYVRDAGFSPRLTSWEPTASGGVRVRQTRTINRNLPLYEIQYAELDRDGYIVEQSAEQI